MREISLNVFGKDGQALDLIVFFTVEKDDYVYGHQDRPRFRETSFAEVATMVAVEIENGNHYAIDEEDKREWRVQVDHALEKHLESA